MPEATAVPGPAWRVLALGVAAQAAATFVISTPAYLIPYLHLGTGMSLAQAGALASAPNVGMVLTLVLWGALADRYGERWVIAAGMALTGAAALGAAAVDGILLLGAVLLLSGAAAASINAASGRVVVGWFPLRRRGLAMGIRQMSVPLGLAVAAVVVPPLAERYGTAGPLLAGGLASVLLAAACAAGIADPPRPPRSATDPPPGNPYRGNAFLLRIHVLSVLLVIPQFTLSIFSLVWLIASMGWSPAAAGIVVGISQLVGAFGRIAVGVLSDRVGSRVRVLRWVAVSAVAVMLLLALTDVGDLGVVAGIVLVLAVTVSVADNGLAFTSVAEAAGSGWAGRALGIQNTGQFIASSALGPVAGALITAVGYPLTFALVALAPLLAIPLVPRQDKHRR
ncbi:MFS transporter [Sediminivirga luteola]|uniref:Putative major facilitator superfamily protein n=1 Tax=Sediminivirga luteola TaxID=1774748 RepID=A0A8J2XL41_9MICO|nr:MFS transporter [Sediminivirga luteola]GGA19477.1 putative major facilitator superfamily protein [Sediminivirga luteola]